MKTIEIPTTRRCEFIDITSKVEEIVRREKMSGSMCLVFCPHTTAGLTINENADPFVSKDVINHLDSLVPADKSYSQLKGNSDSHIKAALIGSSLNIIVEGSNLVLGVWQGIYFCEFDGPRSRKVYVKIVK